MQDWSKDDFIDYFVSSGTNLRILSDHLIPGLRFGRNATKRIETAVMADENRRQLTRNGHGYNYVLITGQTSGIDIIEFEPQPRFDLNSYLGGICARLPDLDQAPTVITPSGGFQFYVRLAAKPVELDGCLIARVQNEPHFRGIKVYSNGFPILGPESDLTSGRYDLISGKIDSIPEIDMRDLNILLRMDFFDEAVKTHPYYGQKPQINNRIRNLLGAWTESNQSEGPHKSLFTLGAYMRRKFGIGLYSLQHHLFSYAQNHSLQIADYESYGIARSVINKVKIDELRYTDSSLCYTFVDEKKFHGFNQGFYEFYHSEAYLYESSKPFFPYTPMGEITLNEIDLNQC